MEYFFREDGLYDGWGMVCSIPITGEPIGIPDEVAGLIEAVERDREFPGTTKEESNG